jgi:hypothetical protein
MKQLEEPYRGWQGDGVYCGKWMHGVSLVPFTLLPTYKKGSLNGERALSTRTGPKTAEALGRFLLVRTRGETVLTR